MPLALSHCPFCGSAEFRPTTYSDDFRHNGKSVHVTELAGMLCANCSEITVPPAQVKANHLRIADAKRASENLLTSFEIKSSREFLCLTQQEASLLFGGGVNAFSKYERGEVQQSLAMDRLIRIIVSAPFLLDLLRGWEGLGPVQHGYCGTNSIATNDSRFAPKRMVGDPTPVLISDWH